MSDDAKRKRRKKDDVVRVRKTLSLTEESVKRLEAAAVHEQMDESKVVDLLIEARLSGYHTRVTGIGLGLKKDRPSPAAEVNPDAQEAA